MKRVIILVTAGLFIGCSGNVETVPSGASDTVNVDTIRTDSVKVSAIVDSTLSSKVDSL